MLHHPVVFWDRTEGVVDYTNDAVTVTQTNMYSHPCFVPFLPIDCKIEMNMGPMGIRIVAIFLVTELPVTYHCQERTVSLGHATYIEASITRLNSNSGKSLLFDSSCQQEHQLSPSRPPPYPPSPKSDAFALRPMIFLERGVLANYRGPRVAVPTD